MIGGVKPNIVLIGVVFVTCFAGFLPGITWAFVAGLTANLLVGDPLGSIPLAMLIVAAMVAGGARILGRMVWIYPVVATMLGSVVADLVILFIGQLVGDVAIGAVPLDRILAAALLNGAIAALVIIPIRILTARYGADEAAAW